jgi:hypothetical protein
MSEVLATYEVVGYSLAMPTVTDTLRTALERCGESRYAVSKATGIPQSGLSRFAAGHTMRGDSIDVLAEYLGLALTAKPAARRQRKAVK